MRRFNVVLHSETGWFHPVDQAIHDHPDLSREAALNFNHMADGTGTILFHIEGDRAALERVLADDPDVLAADVFAVEGGGLRAYVRIGPDNVATRLMTVIEEYDLEVERPLEITGDGGLKVTVKGDMESMREAAIDRPAGVDIELDEAGEAGPAVDLGSVLTDRQREVLDLAIAKGYYEIPREATNRDIAADLGCSASTVGEHLRKIEARIISAVGP